MTEQPAEIKGTYLDNFRNIWDLYITDSAADPTALSTATGDPSPRLSSAKARLSSTRTALGSTRP